MSKSKKKLPDNLLVAVASHFNPEGDAGKSAKAVAKTLDKLAKQFRKQRKATATEPVAPAAPTTKQARKVLAGELTAALRPYLAPDGEAVDNLPKPIAKGVRKLATHLVKQRRRKAKRTAAGTPAPEVVAAAPVEALTITRKPKPVPARPAPTPARRPATFKRPAASATPTVANAAPAEAGETA